MQVWRAALGELLGTAVLVFMFDTIVISTLETDVKMPNLILSILLAIIIAILLLAVDPVSGGHINPIVSFSAALIGLISMSRAIIYIIAQCRVSNVYDTVNCSIVKQKNSAQTTKNNQVEASHL